MPVILESPSFRSGEETEQDSRQSRARGGGGTARDPDVRLGRAAPPEWSHETSLPGGASVCRGPDFV